jgi:predicted ArsR family transcriptional regulator
MASMDVEPLEERVRGVATLDHPVTAAVYQLVVERAQLSREQVADSLGIARSVAAFHLDKLVDAGLAEVRFERLTGRTGPGAGRPAKVYRRSDREITVSLPERHYDLAGGLLAEAVERASVDGIPVERALRDAATETGQRIGEAARIEAGTHRSRAQRLDATLRALERLGYEPRRGDDEIVLANCPFHALAEQHRLLVCGMNLDLLAGMIDGIGSEDLLTARLAPEPGYCCVRLRPS